MANDAARIGALVGIGLGVMGCQGAPEAGEGAGYVLIDREARAAGFVLEVDGQRFATAMPREVAGDADAELIGPTGRTVLSSAAGELLHVKGKHGRLESLDVGGDVDGDKVLLEGSRDAALEVANALGGELVESDGAWEVRAKEALVAAALLDDPAGLEDVRPAALEVAAEAGDDKRGGGWSGQAALAPQMGANGFGDVMERVREAEANMSRFDLPPAVTCRDSIAGVWMSQAYSPMFRDWYVFTLRVQKNASGELTGSIQARSWDGDLEQDTAPSSCDGRAHWTVTMEGTGTLENGRVRFGGTSWKPEQTLCGRMPGLGEYNLDQFSGVLEGSRILSVNNDGGRMKDAPTPFRRVACE